MKYNESIIGNTYGKLTVVELSHTKNYKKYFKCSCSCGNTTTVYMNHLKSGHTTSCGCANTRQGKTTHKASKTSLYKRYYAMLDRCHNPKATGYFKYGAKGITVCQEWLNNFESFKNWAESNGYSPELTIDRIDVTKGYSPENCRWVDYHIQAINKAKSIRNTSGVVGVSFNNSKGIWIGKITQNGKITETIKSKLFDEAVAGHIKYLEDNNLTEQLKSLNYGT